LQPEDAVLVFLNWLAPVCTSLLVDFVSHVFSFNIHCIVIIRQTSALSDSFCNESKAKQPAFCSTPFYAQNSRSITFCTVFQSP
jgi:hypothetical protein